MFTVAAGDGVMVRILYLTVSLCLFASPVLAGHGTIRETDTEIIIEYYGDDDDKLAADANREAQQKEEEKKAIDEIRKAKAEEKAAVKANRIKERHKDEE
jgi:hypothetical protein